VQFVSLYRVSINSFPDYKHSLQENYLDMLESYVEHQLEEFQPWVNFQKDGPPPHWGSDVRRFFGCNISKQVEWERWSDNLATTIAGYHSPWLIFIGGMLRTKCFRHQFQILQIWRQEIADAFATITDDMLENTWRETDYRLDVLRATKGAHVEVH